MYKCQQCTKTFHWPGDLKRHITIKHTTTNVEQAIMEASETPAKRLKMQHPLQLSSTPITFQHPFTMTISGPTSSGKTYFVRKMLESELIAPLPDRIVYLYKRWQPLYDTMKETVPNIEFVQGIPQDIDRDDFFDVNKRNMVILDDMMTAAAGDAKIADLFTEGSHHRSLDVVNLTQNLFPYGKSAVSQRRNTQYMIVFKSPMSKDQIRTLGSFMYPRQLNEFLQIYNQATETPYGYLVIDAKQTTPEEERFKTDIFKHVQMPEHQCEHCDAAFESPISLFTHTLNHSVSNEDNTDMNAAKNDIVNEEVVVVNKTHKTDLNPHSSPKPEAGNIKWLNMDSSDSESSSDSSASDTSTDMTASADSTVDDNSTDMTSSEDSTDTDTESVWDDMISDVYERDEFEQLVSEYNENGEDEETANASAKRDMLDQNVIELGYRYFKLLFTYHRLKKTKIHLKTMKNVKRLQRRYSFKKSLKTAIHESQLFRRMLENDIEDEEDDDKRYFKDFSKE